mgnify:CR=1 FL=1
MRPLAAVLLTAPLLLAACASPAQLAAQRQARLAGYDGMSEAELVHTLGPPASETRAGDHTVMVYQHQYREWVQASPFNGTPPELLGLDYNGLPPILRVWSCDTTFELVGGKVAAAQQRGNYCGGTA